MKTIPLYVFLLVLFGACNTLKYTSTTQKALPELGAIGVFQEYALQNSYDTKAIIPITQAIRLQWQEQQITERRLFKSEANASAPMDSTLMVIQIVDKVGLTQLINQDNTTLAFLKKAEAAQLITGVTVSFSTSILNTFRAADEAYLIQHKEKTLSIELRRDNNYLATVEFAEGSIVNIEKSSFCWGQNRRRDIVIFDLVPSGSSCTNDTYRTARQAIKKNEFKFFK